jgi:hypothetical protein
MKAAERKELLGFAESLSREAKTGKGNRGTKKSRGG